MNDDRVLSRPLTCELFRQKGGRPGRTLTQERKRRHRKDYEPPGSRPG
jgi:hypothetical protein